MSPGKGPLKVGLVAMNQVGYRSLALGYVRAHAEAHPKVRGKAAFLTLDLTVDLDPWWVAFRVLETGPDVVGLSVVCWNARKVYETCRILKQAAPDLFVVLGGPEVSPIAEDVLASQPAVDAVVRGEGEETFAELVHVLAAGKRPWMVQGVTARDEGGIVSAPDRPLIEDLDSIPSPYLSGVLAAQDGGAYLETYRGCPYRCGYCFEGKGYGKVRSFSRERVEAEVAAIAGTPGVGTFSFIDPVFNLTDERLDWLVGIMEPHAAAGVRLHTIEVDVERLDAATVGKLVRAGVASVETGPQSVGALALETCRRKFDSETFRAGVEAAKSGGIAVECDLIVGLPGDDVYDFLAGLRFAFELDPGIVQSSTLHVLPGTDFWNRAAELGLAHDPEPPHEVVSTERAPYADIRRSEVMAHALQTVYRARAG